MKRSLWMVRWCWTIGVCLAGLACTHVPKPCTCCSECPPRVEVLPCPPDVNLQPVPPPAEIPAIPQPEVLSWTIERAEVEPEAWLKAVLSGFGDAWGKWIPELLLRLQAQNVRVEKETDR